MKHFSVLRGKTSIPRPRRTTDRLRNRDNLFAGFSSRDLQRFEELALFQQFTIKGQQQRSVAAILVLDLSSSLHNTLQGQTAHFVPLIQQPQATCKWAKAMAAAFWKTRSKYPHCVLRRLSRADSRHVPRRLWYNFHVVLHRKSPKDALRLQPRPAKQMATPVPLASTLLKHIHSLTSVPFFAPTQTELEGNSFQGRLFKRL